MKKILVMFVLLFTLSMSSAFAAISDLTNLSFYYKLDESSGTVAGNSVTSSPNLTNYNFAVNQPGKINTAYRRTVTSGDTSNLSVTSSAFGQSEFTYNVWFNATQYDTAGTSGNTFAYLHSSGLGAYNMFISQSKIFFDIRTSTTTWNSQSWTMNQSYVGRMSMATFVLSQSRNVREIWIDGVKVANTTYTAPSGYRCNGVNVISIGAGDICAGATLTFNGTLDEPAIWFNRSLDATEISELYNNGTGIQYPFGTPAPSAFKITAVDSWNTANINSFNGTMQSDVTTITFSTTNGTADTTLLQNDTRLWNITLDSPSSTITSYHVRRYTNQNISSNLQASLFQVDVSFNATELFTGLNVTNANFTITQSNNSLLTTTVNSGVRAQLAIGTYNVTANSPNYFSKTVNFTYGFFGGGFCGGSYCQPVNTTGTVTNMTTSILNVSALTAGGIPITAFNISINNTVYSYNAQLNTTTGSVLINLLNGTYDVVVDAQNYALSNQTVTVVGGQVTTNATFYLFTTNSVNITFRDELNDTIISGQNITLSIISSVYSNNYTTNNGTLYIDFISPASYNFVFSSPLYATRTYYLQVNNRTTQNLTLYMLSGDIATNVTATVLSQSGQDIDNALIKILRYNLASNSYILRQSIYTDTNGQAVFPAQLNDQVGLYKFIVEFPTNSVVLTTAGQPLYSNTLTLVTESDEDLVAQYNTVRNVSSILSYLSSSNSFRLTYTTNSNDITQACIKVYRLTAVNVSLYNETCSTSSTAVIYTGVENLTGRSYMAYATFVVSGDEIVVSQLSKDFFSAATFGLVGVFICLMATMSFIFIFRESATSILITTPIPVTLTNVMGVTAFSLDVIIAIWIICWIGIMYLNR